MVMSNCRITVEKLAEDVLHRLREAICKKRPILWRSNSWILYNDNATAHRSSLVSDFLEKHGTVTVQQLPYSPDLAPL